MKDWKFIFVTLVGLLILSRVWRLGFPDTYYFDEVYHAFTAQAYAQNDPRGYEWWNQAPEGFAYEWLHPPLAKLAQAASIKILGDNTFSWRLPSALFGVGTGILLFLFGKNILGSWRLGLLALFAWVFDGLSLTMSRITMNDSIFVFWVVLAFYFFFLKKPLWQVGLALGLSLATKWSGIFALGIILFFWVMRNFHLKHLAKAMISLVVIPAAIYLASYSQFFLQGHTFSQFRELHQQIWWYQTNLSATHPYSSTPIQWVTMSRPIYAFTQSLGENVSNLYLMGNPILFWGGILAAAYLFLVLIKRRMKEKLSGKDLLLGAVLLSYLAMFLPWSASPRVMFLYHYLPALSFLFLMLAWMLDELWKAQKKELVVGFLALVLIVFFLFYPHWTGLAIPQNLDQLYYLIPSWR